MFRDAVTLARYRGADTRVHPATQKYDRFARIRHRHDSKCLEFVSKWLRDIAGQKLI